MYALERNGFTEIGDLQHAVEKKRAAVLEAFVAAGVPRRRISRLEAARDAPRRAPARREGAEPELLAAARRGSLRGVAKALAAGADPDARDAAGYRPLMLAALRGHRRIVERLLERGAGATHSNPRHPNRSGVRGGATALSMAIERNHLDVARVLAERVELRRRSKAAAAAVFAAAAARRAAHLELLASRGLGLAVRGGAGQTPLHVAASLGVPACIRLLIAAGADPNDRDRERATPLHWAIANGKQANAAALLRGGADPSLKDRYRRDALATARVYGVPKGLLDLLRGSAPVRRARRATRHR